MTNKVDKHFDDKFVQQKWVIAKIHRSFQQQVVKIKLNYTISVYIRNIDKDNDWIAGSLYSFPILSLNFGLKFEQESKSFVFKLRPSWQRCKDTSEVGEEAAN